MDTCSGTDNPIMPTKKDLESKARSKGLDLWEYVVELLTELVQEAITSFESQSIEEGKQISIFHKMLEKHFPKVPDPTDLPLLGSEEDVVSYAKRLAKKLLEEKHWPVKEDAKKEEYLKSRGFSGIGSLENTSTNSEVIKSQGGA